MIDVDLARRLRDAGLRWRPAPGDRFVVERLIDGEDGVGDVFTLSDMTIEAHEHPTGTVLGFNGTTEWALDSVAADDALWLPREDQLRELLGSTFRSLDRIVVAGEPLAYRVTVALGTPAATGSDGVHVAADPETAYAHALLAYVDASLRLDGPGGADGRDGTDGSDGGSSD
jgi:hypothetical protein